MHQYDIRILDQIFLRGPNRWSYRPALEALVDALSKRGGHLIEVGRVETMADGIRVTIVLQRSDSLASEGGAP